MPSSCLEIVLLGPSNRPNLCDLNTYRLKDESYVEFPVYNLVFESLLSQQKTLHIQTEGRKPLLDITLTSDVCCTITTDSDRDHRSIIDACYRCGLIVSPYWEKVARSLSAFDDVILGIDTNLLMTAVISEQIINSLSLIDPRVYVHTPNWVLIVIPNAVVHELEQLANTKAAGGF